MKFYKHYSIKYIVDRSKTIFQSIVNPELPWLTNESIQIISKLLSPDDIGLEIGSGRSTNWFAKRSKFLTSLENDVLWFKKVKLQLERSKIFNKVNYQLLPNFDAFENYIDDLPDESLDFCLIDGGNRGKLSNKIIPKLKSNSFLIIDNINWYLPSESISPGSIRHGARVDKEWYYFSEIVFSKRKIWTSNGVTDTAIYFL